MRWSSGFLKSSATTLWSMYCTARSTATRGTSSCSNCMKAIVPVASWSNVWSTRMPIGRPGSRSPSTRCSLRIRRVRFSGTVEYLPDRARGGFRHVRGRDEAVLAGPPRAPAGRRDLDERAHRGGARVLDDEVPRVLAGREGQRLLERRGDDAGVGGARLALVVLLDEEPADDAVAARRPLELEVQPEDVGQAAAEAQVVVDEEVAHGSGRGRSRTICHAITTISPANATCTTRPGTRLTIATPATA